MNAKRILFLVPLFFCLLTYGQDLGFVQKDTVYQSSIKTILMNGGGDIPIVRLGTQLNIKFDELEQEERYVRYVIEHCDRYWQPSQLSEMEYLVGFNNSSLNDKEYSSGPYVSYIQYSLSIPNADVQLKLSGNYMLHIYDEDTDERLLSRRFVMYESNLPMSMKAVRPRMGKPDELQQLEIEVKNENQYVKNPELTAELLVIQNHRWDNAQFIKPDFNSSDPIKFGWQNPIQFNAGKEFRMIDFREINYYCDCADTIVEHQNGYTIVLKPAEQRLGLPNTFTKDINGSFTSQRIKYYNDTGQRLNAEYLEVVFFLEAYQSFKDKDVYVVGSFNDWSQNEQTKMTYDEERNRYYWSTMVRQGSYGYAFSLTDDPSKLDFTEIDGNWFETANRYDALLYYRPYGAQYDQVISYYTLGKTQL